MERKLSASTSPSSLTPGADRAPAHGALTPPGRTPAPDPVPAAVGALTPPGRTPARDPAPTAVGTPGTDRAAEPAARATAAAVSGTASITGGAPASGVLARVRRFLATFPPGTAGLMWLTLGSVALLLGSLLMQVVDGRQVLGVSTWLKPAKFGASTAITVGTLAVLLRWMQPFSRGTRRALAIIVGLLTLELVIITLQAGRGVPSHFNASTALNRTLFGVMGAAIAVVWGAFVYLTWRAFRQPFADRAFGWSIRLGLLAMVLGSGLGFVMPRPTAAQLASLTAGRPTPAIGAHAVGVPDGGPGLPVTGWSTEGGDLRIPHFVGMHGLQLVPLLGWAVARRRRRDATRLSVVAGLGYLGLTGVVLLQALRGQPLLAPDGWTWLSLGALVLASALVARWPARGAERSASAQLAHPASQDGAHA
jgi:hypothetical protein